MSVRQLGCSVVCGRLSTPVLVIGSTVQEEVGGLLVYIP